MWGSFSLGKVSGWEHKQDTAFLPPSKSLTPSLRVTPRRNICQFGGGLCHHCFHLRGKKVWTRCQRHCDGPQWSSIKKWLTTTFSPTVHIVRKVLPAGKSYECFVPQKIYVSGFFFQTSCRSDQGHNSNIFFTFRRTLWRHVRYLLENLGSGLSLSLALSLQYELPDKRRLSS